MASIVLPAKIACIGDSAPLRRLFGAFLIIGDLRRGHARLGCHFTSVPHCVGCSQRRKLGRGVVMRSAGEMSDGPGLRQWMPNTLESSQWRPRSPDVAIR